MKIKDVFQRLKSSEFTDKLGKDKLLDMSAALSYYTALSLAPLLVIMIFGVSFVGDDLKKEMITQFQSLVGKEAGQTIGAIAMNADKTPVSRNIAGIFGILTLLLSASAIFTQLRESLNVVFEVSDDMKKEKPPKSFFRTVWDFALEKLFSMGMVLTFVFISVVSLVASSVVQVVFSGSEAFLGQVLAFAASQLVFSFVFGSIYYFLPERKIRPKVAFVAGLVTAFLFTIGKQIIGIYLGQSAIGNMYGAAGSLIVLLMWVYYSSLIVFISAEIANEINKLSLIEHYGVAYAHDDEHGDHEEHLPPRNKDGRDLFH